MNTDNINKTKACILYVLNEIQDGVDFLKLFKIIYFANQNHLVKYGRVIVDEKFFAMQNGPVLTGTYDSLRNDKLDFIERNPEGGYMIFAKEIPDMDELSVSDVECLTASIDENKNLSFRVLSKKSHDSAWTIAWESRNGNSSVPMDTIEIARAGGASEDIIEYIKEDLFIDSCI
jgi:uncharacterized phage-associated protein